MAQSKLKSLLGKRSDTTAWVQAWVERNNAEICILDENQNVLYGTPLVTDYKTSLVTIEDEIVGQVQGYDDQIIGLSEILAILLKKESEKKKLGAEVLHLYQELNVIYNFSEKLAETIDPNIIAQITLDQALRSLPSDGGILLLWDDITQELSVPAISDNGLFNNETLSTYLDMFKDLSKGGQSEIISDLTFLKSNNIIINSVSSLVYAAMKVKQHAFGVIILADKEEDKYTAAHLKLLVTLALQSSTAIESAFLYEKNIREVREREEAIIKIHEVTKKFVPNEFIRSLGKESITDVRLGDLTEKIVTVLFTDIRDFTSISEKMTPMENFKFVSSFNERLGPVIRSHNGFINQYLGDSIMAIFPDNPKDALLAAIGMQKATYDLNMERKELGLAPIKAGIGMHTGPLILGITGDEFRLDAATISDTVNTAARIEGLTKYYKAPLILSDSTLQFIPDLQQFQIRNLGRVLLKGKNNVLGIKECLNGITSENRNIRAEMTQIFNRAIKHYQDGNFERAIALFDDVLSSDPDDYTASIFRGKSSQYLRHGPPTYWNGADEILSK